MYAVIRNEIDIYCVLNIELLMTTKIVIFSPNNRPTKIPVKNYCQIMFAFIVDNVCLHNDKKVDLAVIVDCATTNPIVLKRWKIQLMTAINSLFEDLDFRLALISYQNHVYTPRLQGAGHRHSAASLGVFTDKKEQMKNNIESLRCLGKKGSRKGLAAGLALAVQLSEDVSVHDFQHFRPEAVKICVLLRKCKFPVPCMPYLIIQILWD